MTANAGALRPGRRAAEAARMIGNETGKGLRVLWSHRATLAPQIALMAVMYLLFQLVLGGGHLVANLLPETLFAYMIYVVSYIALLKMAAGMLEEVNAGTLEQAHLGPLRPWQLSAGRLGAVLAEGLLTAAILGASFTFVFGIAWPVRPVALVPIVVTLADISGFALLITGLALVVNSIGAIIHVINSTVMMINGSVVPIVAFPHGLEVAAKFAPTTLGIDTTRRMLFEGQSLAAVWGDHSLRWALGHAAVMLAVGWAAYHAAIARGLRDGRLGP